MGNCWSCYPLDALSANLRPSPDTEEEDANPSDSARLLYNQLSSRRNADTYGTVPTPIHHYPGQKDAVSSLRYAYHRATSQGLAAQKSKRSPLLASFNLYSTVHSGPDVDFEALEREEHRRREERKSKARQIRIQAVVERFTASVTDVRSPALLMDRDPPPDAAQVSADQCLPPRPTYIPSRSRHKSFGHSRAPGPPKWYQDTLVANLMDHEREESRNAYERHQRKLELTAHEARAALERREMRKKRSDEAQEGRRRQLEGMAIDRQVDHYDHAEDEKLLVGSPGQADVVGENNEVGFDARAQTRTVSNADGPTNRGGIRRGPDRRVTWNEDASTKVVA